MHYAENALPSRKRCEACRKFPVVSESIIRSLLHIGSRRPPQREVNHQGPCNNCLPRHKSPEPRILAVIAIVAQHEVFTRRHHEFSISRKGLQLPPPRWIDIWIGIDPCRKIVPERVRCCRLKSCVGLVKNNAIHRDPSVLDPNAISWNSDDALHKIRRTGMM